MNKKRWIEIHEDNFTITMEFYDGKPVSLGININNMPPSFVLKLAKEWIINGDLSMISARYSGK